MEPGTFKDRLLLEGDPHQLIEGMIIAGHAIEADVAYIFVRGEYTPRGPTPREGHRARLTRGGYLGKNIFGSGYSLEMYLHASAGRYMCGEETATAQRAGRQTRQPARQAAFSAGLGPLGQAHRRQ